LTLDDPGHFSFCGFDPMWDNWGIWHLIVSSILGDFSLPNYNFGWLRRPSCRHPGQSALDLPTQGTHGQHSVGYEEIADGRFLCAAEELETDEP
jgi:hypothetical protein